MNLLVITLDDSEEFLKSLSGLKDHGMNGIVIPTTSLKHALLHNTVDAAPIFGGVSKLMNQDYTLSHTCVMLIPDEKVEEAKQVVLGITKGLGRKGVMFALPVTFWEGIDF